MRERTSPQRSEYPTAHSEQLKAPAVVHQYICEDKKSVYRQRNPRKRAVAYLEQGSDPKMHPRKLDISTVFGICMSDCATQLQSPFHDGGMVEFL
jgi:hypothetical protein